MPTLTKRGVRNESGWVGTHRQHSHGLLWNCSQRFRNSFTWIRVLGLTVEAARSFHVQGRGGAVFLEHAGVPVVPINAPLRFIHLKKTVIPTNKKFILQPVKEWSGT